MRTLYRLLRPMSITALLLAALALVSCVQKPPEEEDFSASYLTNYAATQAARTPSIAETGQVLTDPDGSDNLRRRLGISSLMGHQVSFEGDTLQIDYTFSPAAPMAELTEARRFARDKLLLQQLDGQDPGYYDRLLSSAPVQGAVTQVICRLFIGETLALQDNWTLAQSGGAVLLSYENTLPLVAPREASPALLSAAAGVIKGSLPSAQLTLQCSATDRVLLVQVKTDRHIDPDLTEPFREPLARELAQRAVNSAGERYPVLVVQYYAGSTLYYEDVCLSADGITAWLGEADWGNLPQVQAVLDRPAELEPGEESGPSEPETEPETAPEDPSDGAEPSDGEAAPSGPEGTEPPEPSEPESEAAPTAAPLETVPEAQGVTDGTTARTAAESAPESDEIIDSDASL